MTDTEIKTSLSAILNQFADIEKLLGELAIAVEAQRLALDDVVPGFEAQVSKHLAGAEVRKIKQKFQHSIDALVLLPAETGHLS